MKSNFFYALLCIAVCAAPASAEASIVITEVMYNPDGSDSGNEWVELYNAGSSAITLSAGSSGWKFNDGSNHNLVDPADGDGRGTLTIAAGTVFVLTSNPAQFIASHPGSYTVIKSAISLNNTAATLSFTDNTGVVHDSVSYASELGASDDGNSLHRNGSSFIAGAPTMGSFTETLSGSQTTNSQTASSTSTSTASTSAATTTLVPSITVKAESDEMALVGAGTLFEAAAFGIKGEALTSNVRYVWNFGDGGSAEGKRVFHTFQYPGSYVVWVTAAYNYYSGSARMTMEAVVPEVVLRAEGDGSLTIVNESPRELNIGLWSLSEGGISFTIPEDTFVSASEGIRFSPLITKLAGTTAAALLYQNGSTALYASLGANSPARGERVSAASLRPSVIPIVQAQETTQELEEPKDTNEDLSASVGNTSTSFPWWSSVAGLIAILVLGATGAYYARARPMALAETEFTPEEFDIEWPPKKG
jgi:hypothetical protein